MNERSKDLRNGNDLICRGSKGNYKMKSDKSNRVKTVRISDQRGWLKGRLGWDKIDEILIRRHSADSLNTISSYLLPLHAI